MFLPVKVTTSGGIELREVKLIGEEYFCGRRRVNPGIFSEEMFFEKDYSSTKTYTLTMYSH